MASPIGNAGTSGGKTAFFKRMICLTLTRPPLSLCQVAEYVRQRENSRQNQDNDDDGDGEEAKASADDLYADVSAGDVDVSAG